MAIGFRAPFMQEADSFHDLWKQYKLGRELDTPVGLVLEGPNNRLKIAIAPSLEENLRALESLPQKIRLLLVSERAPSQQWKGAMKLLHIAQKKLKEASIETVSQGSPESRAVLLDELTSLQIALFQKVIGHDPLPEEEMRLASKMSFAPFLLDQVRENPSRLLQIDEKARDVLINYLFVRREIPVIKQLFLQKDLLPILSMLLSREAVPVVQEIVSFLLETGGRDEKKRGVVIQALVHLLEKLPAESTYPIGDALKAWSVHLDPETEIVPGKRLSDLFRSCCYPTTAHEGVLSRFLQRETNEASSEVLCRQFLALRSLPPALKPEYFPRSFNVVEAALWFRMPPKSLAPLMNFALLENELSKIQQHLSREVYERFLFSCWEVDPAHFPEKCYESPTALPPAMKAEDILSFYDTQSPIPVEEMRVPRADERGRISPFVLKRADLQEFVRKVRGRVAYTGTPRFGSPQLEAFYNTIEIHLCHTVKLLREQQARARKPEEVERAKEKSLSFLCEIADATDHCGGRYFGTALSEYFKASGQGDTPRKKALQALADLRKTIFEQAALRRSDTHNVNGLNAALREHGARWGIPGSDTVSERRPNSYRDPFGRSVSREEIASAFRESYTTKEMFHWLCPDPQSQEARSLLVDYCRTPVGWKAEYYQGLEKKIDEIASSTSATKEKKEQDIRACLAEANIEMESDQTPQQAIQEAQRLNFIEEYVQDSSSAIKPRAVLQMLENLGAVRCVLSYDRFLSPRAAKKPNVGELLGHAWGSLTACLSETVQGIGKIAQEIVGRC